MAAAFTATENTLDFRDDSPWIWLGISRVDSLHTPKGEGTSEVFLSHDRKGNQRASKTENTVTKISLPFPSPIIKADSILHVQPFPKL